MISDDFLVPTVSVGIQTMTVCQNRHSHAGAWERGKCRQLVREWAEFHREELVEMWETQNFHKIEPLE